MRALVLAASDPGGSLYYLCEELRRGGHADARLVTLDRHPTAAFPTDVADVHDGGQETRALLRGAEVLHLVDLLPREVTLFDERLEALLSEGPRRALLVQHETPAPKARIAALREAAVQAGGTFVTTRSEGAALADARFLPPFIPYWRGPWSPVVDGARRRAGHVRPLTVFASSLSPMAERPALERLLDTATDLAQRSTPPLLVETQCRRTHRHVLRRRRQADLVLTASRSRLGRAALEALAQGVPVVADLDDATRELYASLAGSPPPVHDASELADVLDALRASDERSPTRVDWAHRVLDPGRWFQLYAELCAGRVREVA